MTSDFLYTAQLCSQTTTSGNNRTSQFQPGKLSFQIHNIHVFIIFLSQPIHTISPDTLSFLYSLAPNIELPTLTIVLPSSTAI